MNEWLATVRVEIWDDYNEEMKDLTLQVKVKAETYGKASMAADKYICKNITREIGPIKQL